MFKDIEKRLSEIMKKCHDEQEKKKSSDVEEQETKN